MKHYTLYIGSNNETGKLNKDEAIHIINQYFNGYTYNQVIGSWKGKTEDTLKVEIATDKPHMIDFLVVSLKRDLAQDSIMLVISSSIIEFR